MSLEFPAWFDAAFPSLECPKCKSSLKREGIVAEGIRRNKKSKRGKIDTSFYIEYNCDGCNGTSIMTFTQMSMKKFVHDLADKFKSDEDSYDFSDNNLEEKGTGKKEMIKSKISKTEFDDAIKFLYACKTHEEFMMGIGVTPEEIEKYEKEVKDEKEQNGKTEKK